MTPSGRRLLSPALALLFAALPLHAQSSAPAAPLARFRDSLRATRDTHDLHAIEKRLRAAATARHADPALRLRLGFVQLRRGEVEQDHAAFTDAEQTFNAVVTSRAGWPTGWLGLGLARVSLADNESAAAHTVQTIFAGDPVAAAAADFVHTTDAGSGYVEALVEISNIAMRDYHPAYLRAALLTLRRTASRPEAGNAAVLLARSRIERVAGSLDSAWKTIATLRAREPDDPLVLMEAGHIAMARGDDDGAVPWFRGLALADSAVASRYRADLLQLLPDSVMRRFDSTAGEDRAKVVRDFLSVDEYGQRRSAAGRLREHYRRLDHARTAFALPTDRYLADAAVDFEPTGHEMDERGLVWILHGPPDDHTYLNLLSAPPNESWHYKGDDGGELLFHFIRTDAVHGFRRVPSLFDILALTKPLQATGHGDVKAMAARGEAVETYGASWTAQTVQDMLYSREAMSPTYGRMLSRGKNGALELQKEERATGDSSMTRGETRAERYELPLDAEFDAVAVGSNASGQVLQVAFAIPGSSLYASPSVRPVVYPVRMRVSVIRRGSGQVVAAIDTLRNFVAAAPVPIDGTLFGRLPIPVPAGDYTVRIALETPGRGVMGPRQVVRVAGANGQKLDLSDLALGARSIRLPWRTQRGDSLWVNPSRAFHAAEPLQLYFEVFGLAAGASYKYDLAVFRDGDSRAQLQLGFSARAGGSIDPVHREIDLSKLRPGSYQLQVTIVAASGEQVVRRGEFTVVK